MYSTDDVPEGVGHETDWLTDLPMPVHGSATYRRRGRRPRRARSSSRTTRTTRLPTSAARR